MSPISSRKSVPPEASRKRPARGRGGAREGAAFVAEELALEQLAGIAAALIGDEGAVGAGARGMDRVGDELLARAALAGDQHGDVARGRPCPRS